jgi:hypothetical protein
VPGLEEGEQFLQFCGFVLADESVVKPPQSRVGKVLEASADVAQPLDIGGDIGVDEKSVEFLLDVLGRGVLVIILNNFIEFLPVFALEEGKDSIQIL